MAVEPAVKILVTGANGFVGRHFIVSAKSRFGERVNLLATSRYADDAMPCISLDVTDAAAVAEIIGRYQPTHILNLAGLAAPKSANDNPDLARQVHFDGLLNVGRAIAAHAPACCLIAVGTGLCYGATAKRGIPLFEDAPLAPLSVYEQTKAAGDLLAGALALDGLHVIRVRPFNHTGPGQTPGFVAPDFALQIARIEAGQQAPLMKVGNLDAERDFLDVRDVADAYVSTIERSSSLETGTVLNIASGVPTKIRSILDGLLKASTRQDIAVAHDPARMRATEIPCFIGDSSAARRRLGWRPRFHLDQTLADLLAWSRTQI